MNFPWKDFCMQGRKMSEFSVDNVFTESPNDFDKRADCDKYED